MVSCLNGHGFLVLLILYLGFTIVTVAFRIGFVTQFALDAGAILESLLFFFLALLLFSFFLGDFLFAILPPFLTPFFVFFVGPFLFFLVAVFYTPLFASSLSWVSAVLIVCCNCTLSARYIVLYDIWLLSFVNLFLLLLPLSEYVPLAAVKIDESDEIYNRAEDVSYEVEHRKNNQSDSQILSHVCIGNKLSREEHQEVYRHDDG